MAYYFIRTQDPKNPYDKNNVTVEMEHNEQSLTDLCESFTDFLRGCGFHFTGTVDIVDESEDANVES